MTSSRRRFVCIMMGAAGVVVLVVLGWLVADAVFEHKADSLDFASFDPAEPERSAGARLDPDLIRRAVGPDGLLASHIDFFRKQVGRYPFHLGELLRPPSDPTERMRWHGPYLNSPRLLRDPWRRRYRYVSPGGHNPDRYDLWSVGADGIDDTHDDIGNW